MKAKKVFENINFERGQDPVSSMAIGMEEELNKIYGRQWVVIYKTQIHHTPRYKGPIEYKLTFDTSFSKEIADEMAKEARQEGLFIEIRYLETYKDFYSLCDELGLPRPKYNTKKKK